MNRNLIVRQLRQAKTNAALLTGNGKQDAASFRQVVELLDQALETLGESTASTIGVNTISRTDAAPTRFGNTPPAIYIAAALKEQVEKKSAPPADQGERDQGEVADEQDEASDDDDATALEGAAAIGNVTETDISQEFLAEIAESDNQSLVRRFASAETLQALITQLGGKNYPGKSETQLAALLKKAAKANLK